MARTWFVDHGAGSVNNSGDSLAITQQGSDATISGSTLTVASGGLTGKAGRTIAVNNSGTYRVFIIASITNDTTATLTALDVLANVSGVAYIIGGAWSSLNSAVAARVKVTDTVKCKKSPAPTSIGNATWTQSSNALVLAGALTLEVDSCDVAWTQGANVTQAQAGATRKEGTNAQQFTTAAGFTTGSVATKTVVLDLSSYQQICLWIRLNTTAIAAGVLELRLKHGATVRHTVTIPAIAQTAVFFPVVVDLGTNMATDIDTLELFANSAQTSKVIIIDNIFAAKASSNAAAITLNSLLSKSSLDQGTVSSEGWYAIDSITGTSVILRKAQTSLVATAFIGYGLVTETVTTYKREQFMITAAEAPPAITGASGSFVTYSGGWDTTDMSTQTGETWLNLASLNNVTVLAVSGNFNTVDRFGVVGGAAGIVLGNQYGTATNLSAVAVNAVGVTINIAQFLSIDNIVSVSGTTGISVLSGGAHRAIGTLRAESASVTGIDLTGTNFTVRVARAHKCGLNGISLGPNVTILGGDTALNAPAFVAPTQGAAFARNFTCSEGTPVSSSLANNVNVTFENFGGVAGDTRQYSDSWLARTDTTVKHGSTATQSWKLAPTNNLVRIAEYPGILPLGKIAVNANTTYTVTAWFARNNSAITVQLAIPGLQLSGIASADATAAMSTTPTTITAASNASPIAVTDIAHGYTTGDGVVISGVLGNTAANGSCYVSVTDADHFSLYSDSALTVPIAGNGNYTSGGAACKWQQLSLSFTPTEKGVVSFEARAYGGSTNLAWVSDAGVS